MVLLKAITAAAALLGSTTYAAPSGGLSKAKRDLKFAFGDEKIRGVNLGGWFVLEPWITPSIFEATPENVVDEYTMSATLGPDEMRARMERHWSTWITSSDFSEMAAAGINMVRIPIGYWSLAPRDSDPYIQGAATYLAQALDWADATGIKVMLDLHGAPESQNGFDNSGKRGGVGWTQGDTVRQTLEAVRVMRDDYASHPAVAAIELLDEPMGPSLDMDVVRQFYMDGWGNLRDSDVAITFHDAFVGATSWNEWGAGMWSLLLDTHHYEVFDSAALGMGLQEHVGTACGFGAGMATNNKWTISGEWSGALTDCAKWLNGRGVGARYDGTFNRDGQGSSYIGSCDGKSSGSVEDLSQTDKDNIRTFIEAQLVAYEKADGWIFWTWKNEAAPEWHMKSLLRNGLFPIGNANPSVCG